MAVLLTDREDPPPSPTVETTAGRAGSGGAGTAATQAPCAVAGPVDTERCRRRSLGSRGDYEPAGRREFAPRCVEGPPRPPPSP